MGKQYSERTLRRIRQFYLLLKNEKWSAGPTKLSWSHYCELLILKDTNKIRYYIDISIKQNLSYRQLHNKIKNKEYERLSDETKEKLIIKEDTQISDFIKNPIVIKNRHNFEKLTEKLLKELILENIEDFMKELGEGYCYIDKEFKIRVGDRYNYIDLLLFNIKYNCYTVKVTELKKEHIGQIECYMNYVDKNIKTINQDRTIGIIICKKDNKYVIDYCSDPRIYRTEFILS